MKWITRERPKIDRIACPWLVARFIDAAPEFLYRVRTQPLTRQLEPAEREPVQRLSACLTQNPTSEGVIACLKGLVAPLRIGQNLKEILEADLAGELDARKLYAEARDVCREHGDYVSMNLFEELLKDEEGHIDFLEGQLQVFNEIGAQNYGQLQAEPADDAD